MNEFMPSLAGSSLLTTTPAKRTRKRKSATASAPVPKRMRASEVRLLEAERGVRIVFGQKLWDTLVRRAGISKMTPAELLREPLQALLKEIEDDSCAFVASFDVLLEKQMELLSAEIAAAARSQETSGEAAADLSLVSCSKVQETSSDLTPVSVPLPACQGIPEPAMDLAPSSEVTESCPEPVPVPSPASEDFPDPVAPPTPRTRTHWRDLLSSIRRPGRRAPLTG